MAPPTRPPITAPATTPPTPRPAAAPIKPPVRAPRPTPVPVFGPGSLAQPARIAAASAAASIFGVVDDIEPPVGACKGARKGPEDWGERWASRRRQHEFGAQAADRCGAEHEFSTVERGEIDDDGEPEAGAGLGLVEAAAASGERLTRLRRQARPVVVHHHAEELSIRLAVRLGEDFDIDAAVRPLAGVVHEVAQHLLEVLLLAGEEDAVGRARRDGERAVVVDLLHGAGEAVDHRRHLADGGGERGTGDDAGALQMPLHLVVHDADL